MDKLPRKPRKPLSQDPEAKAKRTAAARKGGKHRKSRSFSQRRTLLMREVFRMKVEQGEPWRKIQETLQISASYAYELYKLGHELLKEDTKEVAARDRQVQLDQLDAITSRVMPLIMHDDLRVETIKANGDVLSIEAFEQLAKMSIVAIRVMERRARILGTDAPEKLNVTDNTDYQTLEQLRERAARARERNRKGLKGLAVK